MFFTIKFFFSDINDGLTNKFPTGCEFRRKIGSTIIAIILELFDVGSDILLAYTLFNGTYDPEKGHSIYIRK